jgi:putative Holliday junction resolvase
VRVLGLDVGDVRIGVALSDETATIAGGLPTLTRVGPRKDVQAVAALVREREVDEIVVGLPRRLDGTLGPQAEKVQSFAADLRRSVRIPVHEWDERFTSVEANRALMEGGVRRKDRKHSVDKVAAVLILQGFLDHRRLVSSGAGEGQG